MNTATAITIAALAALTPTVVCLIGIILQRQDVRDLRAHTDASITALRSEFRAELQGEIGSVRAEMGSIRAEIQAIRADMQQFFAITGRLEGRLDELSKR